MGKTIYDKINKRVDVLNEIFKEFHFNKESTVDIYEKYGSHIIEHHRYTIEFDKLKIDFPEVYKDYLSNILYRYDYLEKVYFFADRSIGSKIGRINLSIIDCINLNIKHLNGMLNPENEIQELSQKFEQLKPFEKILIFHYLNEKNKLFKYPLNSKSGKHFLSRLLDINPESIKNPVNNISDYTTNSVTEKQAENFYMTLEKVKTFFDKSELFEISKIIEIRINVLKRISGKD